MSLTFDQAIAALSDPQYQSLAGLENLVRQVSAELEVQNGTVTTLLYSGDIADVPTWQIANIFQTKQVKCLASSVYIEKRQK